MFRAKDHVAVFSSLSDHSRTFPEKAIQLLSDLHLLKIPIPESHMLSVNTTTSQNLWEALFEVGRADLSVGRLYEGHVNAILLIEAFGSASQKEKYFSYAEKGKLFGVWNTGMPYEELAINKSLKHFILTGAKTFCSGALHVQYPIVTAKTSDGLQMIVLNLDDKHTIKEDWSHWNPSGMRSSVSCRLDFTGMMIDKHQFLGQPDDYYREPHFSFGAVRFSVVQLGAAKAIADIVIDHLQRFYRTQDPYQKMRLGKIAILLETANLWIHKLKYIDDQPEPTYMSEKKVNFANMMRTVTLDICEEIIALAEKSIGIQGMMQTHLLEKAVRDLRVYLKQAGPDAALANVGSFISKVKASSKVKSDH